MTYIFNCQIIPKADPSSATQGNKVINVATDTFEQVIEKINAAYPGCEIKSMSKMQAIDLT